LDAYTKAQYGLQAVDHQS